MNDTMTYNGQVESDPSANFENYARLSAAAEIGPEEAASLLAEMVKKEHGCLRNIYGESFARYVKAHGCLPSATMQANIARIAGIKWEDWKDACKAAFSDLELEGWSKGRYSQLKGIWEGKRGDGRKSGKGGKSTASERKAAILRSIKTCANKGDKLTKKEAEAIVIALAKLGANVG